MKNPTTIVSCVFMLLSWGFLTKESSTEALSFSTLDFAKSNRASKVVDGEGVWSPVAIQAAKDMSQTQLKKLSDAGLIGVQRPMKIIGEPIIAGSGGESVDDADDDGNSKIIHFQRHAQGYHNMICDLWRELGHPIDFDSPDPVLNPMVRPEILDPPLTSLGIQQCRRAQLQVQTTELNPDLVIVSPLLRCIQTAKLSFPNHVPRKDANVGTHGIPWVAHEGCREELGLLVGNKRRSIAEIQQEHADIDFSAIQHNEDILWEEYGDVRESLVDKAERIYDFLTNFVALRPERGIAIVSHSAYLFTLLNAVMSIEDPDLKRWFLTSEIRSMKIRFVKQD